MTEGRDHYYESASHPRELEGKGEGEAGRARELALCLSGGGYRAALFHLGAVRRLDELGVLGRVSGISSVSGGSILAAHLACREGRWGRGDTVFPDFEAEVAAPFRRFTRRNIRTPAILRRLAPWRWHRSDAAVRGLERSYDRHLTGGRRLSELPAWPRFVFCATDLVFGVNWVFERTKVGDYLVGFSSALPREVSLARAVAASSCFPPVFNPLRLGLDPGELEDGHAFREAGDDRREKSRLEDLVRRVGLTDGGVYDNLGMEPFWDGADVLLVSDGGASLPHTSPRNPFRRLLRYTSVSLNQIQALRLRWSQARTAATEFRCLIWRIGQVRTDDAGYSPGLVRDRISTIRTDLDRFSDAEAKILENHGYLVADQRLRTHAEDLGNGRSLAVPHPEWLTDPGRAATALGRSSRRTLLGRW
ncbi:MAG: patatin-like phospholipase family protein [Thermoanaerobaculia bacterium]|nr:patatin-like phospholipase family protein [Thermoanaerobaculia bacterium]